MNKCEICGRAFTLEDDDKWLPDRHDACNEGLQKFLKRYTKDYEELLLEVRQVCSEVIGPTALVALESPAVLVRMSLSKARREIAKQLGGLSDAQD